MNFEDETPELTPLEEATRDQAIVTVILTDGRSWTGTVRESDDPGSGYFSVRTGSRGRPPVFHEADVEDVIFE